MTRRLSLCLVLSFAACQKQPPFPPDLLAENMPGGWRRTATGQFTGAHDPIPANAVDQSMSASYEGPGTLEAHVYQLTAPAVGLDLAQRWRPSADTVFFNQGRYFVVIKWQSADRKALQQFVSAVESKLIAAK